MMYIWKSLVFSRHVQIIGTIPHAFTVSTKALPAARDFDFKPSKPKNSRYAVTARPAAGCTMLCQELCQMQEIHLHDM